MPDPLLAPVPRLALRSPEAAEALGVSERTLHEWRKAGDVPHITRGGVVLFPVRELVGWLTAQAVATDLERGVGGPTKTASNRDEVESQKDY